MSAMASLDSESLEPRLLKAGVLALLVHVVFFIFMTFGLSWKTFPPEGVVVDLWSDLPQPAQLPTKKAKPLRSKPVQPPKKVKPLPPKIEKTPALTKPDITIKKEKIKKPKPLVKKQQTDKKQKARIAAEVERLQKQQLEEEERERLRKKAAGAQAAFKHQLIDEYKAKILAKIKSRLVMPPDLPHDPVAEFDVTLLPGGEILDVKMRKSSGYITFDRAVERAIIMSRPLPLPPDPRLFPSFRNLSLKVHYLE